MTKLLLLAGILLGSVAVILGVQATATPTASALAPCSSRSNTSEEMAFVGLVQAWRDANIPGSHPLTLSAPLNAAAIGYAEFVANTPGAGSHWADGGGPYAWAERAVQCGYPSGWAAGGEGIASVEGSGQIAISGQQAIAIMAGHDGSGIWVPSNVGLPVRCIGVGKAQSASGNKVTWVVLLFAAGQAGCPQAVTAGPSPSPSAATATSTHTPTATATPSPTATPTARADGASVTLWEGWNLVTLPPGVVPDMLSRASGCFRAVYQQQGDAWLRYSPQVPAYANNLYTTNGGTFWIEGTANCGFIQL